MDIDDLKMQTLTQPRSEARARYTRNPATPVRSGGGVAHARVANRKPRPRLREPQLRTWKERALFQGIICAGFLAVLLVFNIIDSAPTNAVTAWMDRNLSYDIFAEDGVGGWTDRLLAIFNNDPTPTDYADVTPTPATPTSTPATTTPNSWVDESILEEINSDDGN